MRRRASLTAVTLVLVMSAPSTHAGGDSVAVRITALSRTSEHAATFVLKGITEDVIQPCRQATISADYSLRGWPWAKAPVTKEGHKRALDHLARDFSSHAETRFGIIGTGLQDDTRAGACHFRSRALSLEEEPSHEWVVYSWFKT